MWMDPEILLDLMIGPIKYVLKRGQHRRFVLCVVAAKIGVEKWKNS